MEVIERIECMSPDFIKKLQIETKCQFKWDPNFTSNMVEISPDFR